jgi:hypothetical protein
MKFHNRTTIYCGVGNEIQAQRLRAKKEGMEGWQRSY